MSIDQTIKNLLRSTKRGGVDKLIVWMEQNEYFTSPASSNTKFHGCHKGGLAKHSYNVYTLFKEKNEKFKLNLPEDTVIVSSLLHDICKAGVYKENKNKDGNSSKTKPYTKDYSLPMGHGEMSVYVIQKEGLKLTDQEAILIRWHMGPFDEGWMQYEYGEKVKEVEKSVVALFTSDWEASTYLDG